MQWKPAVWRDAQQDRETLTTWQLVVLLCRYGVARIGCLKGTKAIKIVVKYCVVET